MTIKDGGPAFPVPAYNVGSPIPEDQWDFPVAGMSLRAYAAVHAMAGLLVVNYPEDPALTGEQEIAKLAVGSVAFADALIAELEKDNGS